MKQMILFLFFSNTIAFSFRTDLPQSSTAEKLPIEQVLAFEILKSKCNVCHRTENPSKVFTIENMNDHAKKIKRQVFFWKRMPKGNDYKLTSKEKKQLKDWINKFKK